MNGAVPKLAVEPPNAGVSLRDQAFHQAIIRFGGCKVIEDMTTNPFVPMRAIRQAAIGQDNRADRSMTEHLAIIKAAKRRDSDRAERLARSHMLGLGRACRALLRLPGVGRNASHATPENAIAGHPICGVSYTEHQTGRMAARNVRDAEPGLATGCRSDGASGRGDE